MDADATLAAIREHTFRLALLLDSDDPNQQIVNTLTDELVRHIDALDYLLTKGGRLPRAWLSRERANEGGQEGTAQSETHTVEV